MSDTIDVTKLVKDVMNDTMERAFYLQSKAFFEKNNEHVTEIARLKAEVERLRAASFVTAVPVEQYERVVKAGDAMADAMDRNGCHDNGDYDENVRVTNEWNAAKEGKQP